MGVPVLTLPGDRLPSRQTLGFLTELGLTDLAAASPDDYVARAKALAADGPWLAELRHVMRPRMAASALCDGPRFTRALETAFREMWRRHCEGQKPGAFDVPAAPAGRAE